jgi:hypothetical protein
MGLDTDGYFSDLMIPISIVAAIQAALLISLKENGAATGSVTNLLGYTIALLAYTFAGHTVEKFGPALVTSLQKGHPWWAAKIDTGLTWLLPVLRGGLFVLTVGILLWTTSEVVNYRDAIFPVDR